MAKQRTKEFEIDWETEDGKIEKKKVVIKRLSFGELNDLLSKIIVITMKGNMPIPEINLKALIEHAIFLSVIEAPWKVKYLPAIQELDPDIGELVYTEVNVFSSLDEIKKKISSGHLNMEALIGN